MKAAASHSGQYTNSLSKLNELSRLLKNTHPGGLTEDVKVLINSTVTKMEHLKKKLNQKVKSVSRNRSEVKLAPKVVPDVHGIQLLNKKLNKLIMQTSRDKRKARKLSKSKSRTKASKKPRRKVSLMNKSRTSSAEREHRLPVPQIERVAERDGPVRIGDLERVKERRAASTASDNRTASPQVVRKKKSSDKLKQSRRLLAEQRHMLREEIRDLDGTLEYLESQVAAQARRVQLKIKERMERKHHRAGKDSPASDIGHKL